MGRTLLALQGDGPLDTDAVVTAATEALRLGDLGLAERLAGGILDRGDDFGARLALSYALDLAGPWPGGRVGARRRRDPPGSLREQLMAWALPRAANQFWMLSEPERATIFPERAKARIGTASHLTLDALSATFA